MQAITEIGEMLIGTVGKEYFFKPSLKRMYQLGTPQEIVEIYAVLNGKEIRERLPLVFGSAYQQGYLLGLLNSPVFGRKILQTAMWVMNCCCDDDLTPLIGEYDVSAKRIVYQKGALSPKEIISTAQCLLTHGIIGRVELDLAQSGQADYTDGFYAIEYISLARTLFGLSRAEAEDLTISELQQLIKSRMPKTASNRHFSDDEYDRIMEEYERQREISLQAENG